MEVHLQYFIKQYTTNFHLSENTKTAIGKHLSLVHFNKKHILIRENQRHDYAYFLIKGAVRSYYLKEGVEINTWFAFENEIVGSLQNFKDLHSRETLELLENSTLIAIKLSALKPLIYTNIEISNFVMAVIEEYALFLELKIANYQLTNSSTRYEALLAHEPNVLKRVPLTYIASYLGITRETLSRLRSK